MRTKSLIAKALLVALAVSPVALTGCGKDAASKPVAADKVQADEAKDKAGKAKDDKKEVPAIPVEVAKAETGLLEPVYAATATLEAEREATIRAEMPGEILAVLVEEGDFVKKGQVLARVDAERAALQVQQAKAVADRMAHEAARSQKLLDRQMISREQHDRMAYTRDSQQAAVDIAALSVEKSVIRAPYDGVITRRHVKQGQWLAVQAAAFDIADFSELKARLDVPERQSELLKPGQPVVLKADAFAGRTFAGQVERLSPVVDRASGTVGVTVAVDNPKSELRPGLFVRVGVAYERIADATMVPKSAIVSDAKESHVFVVDSGIVRHRPVVLGHENGNRVQVVQGIVPGATVVTVGQSALKDGDKVQVINMPVDAVASRP